MQQLSALFPIPRFAFLCVGHSSYLEEYKRGWLGLTVTDKLFGFLCQSSLASLEKVLTFSHTLSKDWHLHQVPRLQSPSVCSCPVKNGS